MSEEQIYIGLASIAVLGVGAQWIAKRRDIPSLLLLLPAGLFAGNVGPLVEPEKLFGDTLFPGVSVLVGLLLFHSGLQLRVEDLPSLARRPVIRLNTVGAFLTLIGAVVAVYVVFDPPDNLALVAGAILVVSGPTVIGPLLEIVRLREPAGSILRWEGTVLDPIGATMGVIALNIVLASEREGLHPLLQMAGRLGLGVLVGVVAGAMLVFVMSRFLVTDQMEAAVGLLFAVAAFAVAEVLLSEAGLFATVTLGLVVANQKVVPTARISGFGETLEVLIIGSLFVVLGALVDIDSLADRSLGIVVLVALLVFIVRPISVWVSLIGTRVSTKDKWMISWVDPRGVVAAATAASFAGALAAAGIDADFLLPVVFGVILGTGLIYGTTAAPVAKLLGLREPPPEGVVLVGHRRWLVSFAEALRDAGANVVLVGPDLSEVSSAAARGAQRAAGSTDSAEGAAPDLDRMSAPSGESELRAQLAHFGIGKAVVDLHDDLAGELLTASLVEVLGRRHVYRVASGEVSGIERTVSSAATAVAFGGDPTSEQISARLRSGASFEVRALSEPDEGQSNRGTQPNDDAAADAQRTEEADVVAEVDDSGRVDLAPGRSRTNLEGARSRIVLSVR